MWATCNIQAVVYPNNILGGIFMRFENILKCHPSFVHLICEEDIIQCDCLSITDGHDAEQMIFLGKSDKCEEYEVRIYKANARDAYVPHKLDPKFKRYEANNEFESFFFNDFISARKFIRLAIDIHPEYQIRPIPKINQS